MLNARAMVAKPSLLRIAAVAAAIPLVAATRLPTLAETQPGLWEISGVPGAKTPIRQCVGFIPMLARFEHRSKNCSAKVLKTAGSVTSVEYVCGSAGFGHSELEVITPRSLRIRTQGISDGQPFNYILQARRVGECQRVTPNLPH